MVSGIGEFGWCGTDEVTRVLKAGTALKPAVAEIQARKTRDFRAIDAIDVSSISAAVFELKMTLKPRAQALKARATEEVKALLVKLGFGGVDVVVNDAPAAPAPEQQKPRNDYSLFTDAMSTDPVTGETRHF